LNAASAEGIDVLAWTWNGGKTDPMVMVTPDWETSPMAPTVTLTKYGAQAMHAIERANDINESILE